MKEKKVTTQYFKNKFSKIKLYYANNNTKVKGMGYESTASMKE